MYLSYISKLFMLSNHLISDYFTPALKPGIENINNISDRSSLTIRGRSALLKVFLRSRCYELISAYSMLSAKPQRMLVFKVQPILSHNCLCWQFMTKFIAKFVSSSVMSSAFWAGNFKFVATFTTKLSFITILKPALRAYHFEALH